MARAWTGAHGARMWLGRITALVLALLAGAGAQRAAAYSYAEGKVEPVIDAREATLAALQAGDFETARAASSAAAADLAYLDEHFGTQLSAELERAFAARDAAAIDRTYLKAFATSVRRRVTAAGENLQDYQSAKILVVRSKRLLDLVTPQLPEPERARAQQALARCLTAIGNPGVFGVGAAPPDPAAFSSAAAEVIASLGAL
jgi:hypothetical protein